MKFLILMCIFIPFYAQADFIAGFGLQGGGLQSSNTSDSGDPRVKTSLFGFKGEIEFGQPYITAFGSFDFATGPGKTQYDYTNPDDSLDKAKVTDLKAQASFSRFSGGMRLKILKLPKFRIFVGGGAHYGFMNLTYDKEDFKEKNHSTTGFEESERQRFNGPFGEAGMEIIFSANSGLRILARRSFIESDKFQTLNDERIKFNYMTISVNFIEYIETTR